MIQPQRCLLNFHWKKLQLKSTRKKWKRPLLGLQWPLWPRFQTSYIMSVRLRVVSVQPAGKHVPGLAAQGWGGGAGGPGGGEGSGGDGGGKDGEGGGGANREPGHVRSYTQSLKFAHCHSR